MNTLMLVLSFTAVFALFVSVCSLIGFGVVKLVHVARTVRDRPRYVGIAERYQAPYVQDNFKRAGQ